MACTCPGGWCSKIKKQINASAGGSDASASDFTIAPSAAHLKPLKDGRLHTGFPNKAWRHARGELPPPKTGNAICSHQLRRALSSRASPAALPRLTLAWASMSPGAIWSPRRTLW